MSKMNLNKILHSYKNWKLKTVVMFGIYYSWSIKDILDVDIKWVINQADTKGFKLDTEIQEYIEKLTSTWIDYNKNSGLFKSKNTGLTLVRRLKLVHRKNK